MAKAPGKTRYGIYEWFGRDAVDLKSTQRRRFLKLAEDKDTTTESCRFASSLVSDAVCSKPGGVCTIRKYQEIDGAVSINDDLPVTVCPQRFLENKVLLQWVGEVMLGTKHPIAVKEIPFLAKMTKDEKEDNKKAGRIDWVLVDPAGINSNFKWCALETQAV